VKETIFCIISAFILYEVSGIIGKEMLADKHITGEGKGYCDITFGKESKKSLIINIQYNIFAPIIYMLLIATVLQNIGQEELAYKAVYIVPCYYLVRWVMITVIAGKYQLFNIKYECISAIPGVLLAFFIQRILILSGKEIFPTVEEFRTQLWLVFFAMAYQFCVRSLGKSDAIRQNRVCTKQMKQKYILDKYELFQRKYGTIIQAEAPGDYLQRVIYAIMIYENFNRPTTQRWCENVLFCLGRRPMTLGIMQVSTTKFIHNAESVELGCRKIKESFQEYVKIAKKENYQGYYFGAGEPELCLEKICEDYNKAEDYVDAIKAIFYTLPDPEYGEYDEARQLLETEEQQEAGETSDFVRAYGMEDLTEKLGTYEHIILQDDYYLRVLDTESPYVSCYSEDECTVYCINGIENLTITGEDAMFYMGAGDYFVFRNCRNITVQNVGFIRQADQEKTAAPILQLENCEDIRLEAVELMGRSGAALRLRHCERVRMKNMRIHDCREGAIIMEETETIMENSQLRRIRVEGKTEIISIKSSIVKLQELIFYKDSTQGCLIGNDNSRVEGEEFIIQECDYADICNQKMIGYGQV
jgi:hypothetical protein